MTDYKNREIGRTLQNALLDMPVVVLTGMRQVGKSTILQQDPALRNRRYVTLDDFAQLEMAKRNPELFLEGEDPLTIDEAQRCPELLVAIKRMVDKKRIPGRFLLSGSANFSLLKSVTESLAGRAIYLTLNPFILREIRGTIVPTPFLLHFLDSPHRVQGTYPPITSAEILHGGMPSVCLGQLKDPSLWFKGYEQTYMDRDLRQLAQVGDLLAFRNLMQLAALRTGQILNLSELGRDAKLNSPTATRYLTLMETSFLIRRIGPYLNNRTSRLIKSPKIYLSDSGLACHLAGVSKGEDLSGDPLRGSLLETFVAQNLTGILESHMPKAKVLFWNIQGRHEVDFVIEAGREVMAIEVKSASRWGSHDLAGLRIFLEQTPLCRAGFLAYNGPEMVQLDKRLWAVPIRLLLS